MNAMKARAEEARGRWNAGDLPGYLTLYNDSIKLHGYAPEPMNKVAVTDSTIRFGPRSARRRHSTSTKS